MHDSPREKIETLLPPLVSDENERFETASVPHPLQNVMRATLPELTMARCGTLLIWVDAMPKIAGEEMALEQWNRPHPSTMQRSLHVTNRDLTNVESRHATPVQINKT